MSKFSTIYSDFLDLHLELLSIQSSIYFFPQPGRKAVKFDVTLFCLLPFSYCRDIDFIVSPFNVLKQICK